MRRSADGLLLCPDDARGMTRGEADELKRIQDQRPYHPRPIADGGGVSVSPAGATAQSGFPDGFAYEARADNLIIPPVEDPRLALWTGGYQSDPSRQPTYEPLGWNGNRPAVKVLGETSDQFMIWDGHPLSTLIAGAETPFSITMVFELLKAPGGSFAILFNWSASPNTTNALLGIRNTGLLHFGKVARDDGVTPITANTKHQIMWTHSGNASKLYLDGSIEADLESDIGAPGTGWFTIGRLRNPVIQTLKTDMRVVHIAAFNKELNSAEVGQVASLMRQTWGGLP